MNAANQSGEHCRSDSSGLVGAMERRTGCVLTANIDVIGWGDALTRLAGWARRRERRMVAVCNAHVVVTAMRNPGYRMVINSADMATADGAPIAWMLRRMGFGGQQRINGPDLMWALCRRLAAEDIGIYFYGSTEETLELLRGRLLNAFPGLRITGMTSPPFRPLTIEEDDRAVADINRSGAGVIFVGLGCPKQEIWMAEHRDRIQGVMIGVGAAFDFHAGTVKRAPQWAQDAGLEWFWRLMAEPKRLWRRYLVTNTLFVVGAARQLVSLWLARRG